MKYIVSDNNLIFEYQKIERKLYDLDNFNPKTTAFPKPLFKKKFDKIVSLKSNDWFHSELDFNNLVAFVKSIGSDTFIASCSPYNLIAPIEVPVSASLEEYVDSHSYKSVEGHQFQGVGIRKSLETFYYDKSAKWAIVSDLTNDITIVGLEKNIVKDFKKAFEGRFTAIQLLSKKLSK